MLLVRFVRHDFYDEVTRITHDKDKEHTNIYKEGDIKNEN